jgi:2-keto-4-pentenoate hydratase/2-oxohepta-3-ene-1,7-dioic acid hydratase in catechol pathway
MKLYTFEQGGRVRIGAACRTQLIDLPAAYLHLRELRGPAEGLPARLPNDMLALLRMGPPGLAAAGEAVAFMLRRPALPVGAQVAFSFDEVRLLAPLPRPGKIIIFSAEESRQKPFIYVKVASAVIGPGAPIVRPPEVSAVQCEAAIGFVIGSKLKAATVESIQSGIAGKVLVTNVSIPGGPSVLAHNYDSFCPMGPAIVTLDELNSPSSIAEADANRIALFTHFMTFEPGDILALTDSQQAKALLTKGDIAVVQDASLGRLENPII